MVQSSYSLNILQIIKYEFFKWYTYVFSLVPGVTGAIIRKIMFKPIFKMVGKGVRIFENVTLEYPENIILGNKVWIHQGSYFHAKDGITIGNNVLISPHVCFTTAQHIYNTKNKKIIDSGMIKKGAIVVEDDVWIGINSVILGGVHIGKGSVVGAGSVVNKDIKSYSIYAGVPARLIKKRF